MEGRTVRRFLTDLGYTVHTPASVFGRERLEHGLEDEDWLPIAGTQHWVVFCRDQNILYRPRELQASPLDLVVYGGFGVLCGFLPLAAAVVLTTEDDLGPGLPQAVAALLGLLSLSALLLRIAYLRVVLHDDHVRVVNPLRTHRIAWSDIEDIDLISQGGWFVRLHVNGTPIRAYGLSKFGRFGANLSSPYDNAEKDAPRWLNDGYQRLRHRWRQQRRNR